MEPSRKAELSRASSMWLDADQKKICNFYYLKSDKNDQNDIFGYIKIFTQKFSSLNYQYRLFFHIFIIAYII